MKEKLKEYALIAEIISAVAILVTLVILILEVRTSNELARLAAYDAITRDIENWRFSVLAESENYDVILSSLLSSEDLQEIEPGSADAFRLRLLISNDLGIKERAFLAYQAGIVGENEWGRLHRTECSVWDRYKNTPYAEQLIFGLTEAYVSHLEDDCE